MSGEQRQIPVIDASKISLANVDVSAQHYDAVGKEFCAALSTWGFAYIKNHGIPWRLVDDCVRHSRKFFEKDTEIKIKYSRDATSKPDGYSSIGREVLENDGLVECKESYDINSTHTTFPKETPRWRGHAQALAMQSMMLGKRLLRCMAHDLGANTEEYLNCFDGMFMKCGNNATALRILRYPAVDDLDQRSQEKIITRCGEHTDYGGLTLLYQDSTGGLEIEDLDGEWVSATPIPETIVVNIGDLMSFWSGGRYKATKHRVRLTDPSVASKDRYSMAMFLHPNKDTEIVPFGTTTPTVQREMKHFLTAGEHVNRRFTETYQKS